MRLKLKNKNGNFGTKRVNKIKTFFRKHSDREKVISPNVFCELNFDGKIRCEFLMEYSAICQTDNSNWPYDIHLCTIILQPLPGLIPSEGQKFDRSVETLILF